MAILSNHTFRFCLNQRVALISGETGEVVGRAQHVSSNDQYNLRYTAADGRLVEQWWDENAIRVAIPCVAEAACESAAATDGKGHEIVGLSIEVPAPTRIVNIHLA